MGPRFAGALLLAGQLLSPSLASAQSKEEELAAVKAELAETRQQLDGALATLKSFEQRLAELEAGAPSAAAAPTGPRIPPVNVDNPAISFVVDGQLKDDTTGSGSDFALATGELFISAPIDPFLRGYASINGTSDEGFDIEEAALITTALPWNFTVKGGRFFADFGRLPHWHDEALPFVDRPPSIDRLIGGESTAEGMEVSWLAPLEHFVEITGGVYNAVGAENLETLNSNGFFGRRQFDEFNFLVRPHTYFDLTDTLNAEIGGSWLGVPHQNDRYLYGVDLTLRHQPGTSELYQGLIWGTEWLWNNQVFDVLDDTGAIIGQTRDHRDGGYSYLEAFFARRYSTGLRFDYSEAPDGEKDLAETISAFVTWMPSEFQRLRFQFDNTWGDEPTNQRFTLQWTAFIGSHSHGFAQR